MICLLAPSLFVGPSLSVSSLLWFASEASLSVVFLNTCFENRDQSLKKPSRSLQGLRIIGKIKYLGTERRGGAQKKSFHPSSPDEEFYSCQNASQGFWGMSPSR